MTKKHLRYLLTFLFLTIVGIGGAKAEEKTTTITASSTLVTYAISNTQSFVQDGVTIRMEQGDGTNAPAYNSNNKDVRLYKAATGKTNGNSMTISCDYDIIKISFDFNGNNYTASNGSFDSGVYSSETKTWTGSAKTVVLTNGSKEQIRIKQFTVTYENGITATVIAPTFSPEAGAIKAGTTVTLTQDDASLIMYTTDGTDPSFENSNGDEYLSPITITTPTTIKAIAVDDEGNESSVVSAAYTISVTAPTFSVAASEVNEGTELTLSAGEGCSIYYTTNGEEPTNKSTQYSNAIVINENVTVKAIAIDAYGNSSNIITRTYTVKIAGGEDFIPTYGAFGLDAQTSGNTTDEVSATTESGVTITYTRNNGSLYLSGSAMRFYKDNDLKFEAPEGKVITFIQLTMSSEQTDLTSTPSGYDNITKKWIGKAETVTLNRPSSASSYAQITKITIVLADASTIKAPTFSPDAGTYFEAQNVTITCQTAGAEIYYSLDGTDPTASSTKYENAITISENKTLKAIAVKGDDVSATAEATYTVVITEGKGTEANPFNVADANKILSADVTLEKVYVKGIVSQIDDINTTQYYNATYYISDDGSTNNQFYVYRGKNIGNTNFTSEEQLQKGDEVVVYGDLTVYGSDKVFEFKQGNYIVSLTRPEPIELATPIIFHDGGTYEQALKVAMAGQGTIKYTLNGGAEQTYSTPIDVNETTTITAWVEQDGAKSQEETKVFTIEAKEAGPSIEDGYYTIKNNGNGKYVNVAGRRTVTFVDEAATAAAPGTVIKVKATDGQLEVLRSQGVDLPAYAEKAMNYVPQIVQLVVDKLHIEGSGELLGENGLKALMKKFDESFDYHLYLEKAGDYYRIYGRTPSMQPVVDFYAENKDNVDAKLPGLEEFINSAIQKILNKTNGSGASILVPFSLETVWENMGRTLTNPAENQAKFYEEVLSSEANVWNFAYQTAMLYWGNLKSHPRFDEVKDKLGDLAKYIDKVENIQPNSKYYIVQQNGQMDIINQSNSVFISDIAAEADFTAWTLKERSKFQVTFPEANVKNAGMEHYTTLYTDFAYTLPEGTKALKVKSINEKTGVAVTEEITGTIPAQTPVMLATTNEELTQTLTLAADGGAAVTDNLLVGPDFLIEKYGIKTAQIESLFDAAKEILGEEAYNTYLAEYEHLMFRNSGTVNNKYFFGIGVEDDTEANDIYGPGTLLRMLNTGSEKLGFYLPQDVIAANQAFIMSEVSPVKLFLKGDVNRDGVVNVTDVSATIDISLGKATPETHSDVYDFDAADADENGTVNVNDAVIIVNISLGKQ